MFKEDIELTAEEAEEMARGNNKKEVIDPATELPSPDAEVPTRAAATEAAEAEAQADEAGPTELERLKAERDQLIDRLARMQAEFENARKRAERERNENREYLVGNIVERFLPVIDNFELALKSTGSPEQLRSGVNLIVKQMEEILSKMQVSAVPTVGEVFDPRMHEALGTVDRDDLPDQHVAEEIRRGYRVKDRLIRPALVRVAHNPKQKSE